MKPLTITAISTAVIGAIFLIVTTIEWPDDGFFNPDIRMYVAGAYIGSALITIAIAAALLAMHANAVGARTLHALEEHAYAERERARRDQQPDWTRS